MRNADLDILGSFPAPRGGEFGIVFVRHIVIE
jgi:hypothetical protein